MAGKVDIKVHDFPYYRRWSGIVQRTTNANNRGFRTIGARGSGIDFIWHPNNKDGLYNFCNWVKEQLKINPKFQNTKFRITRKDINKNYGPTNCHLVAAVKVCQNRVTSVLNEKIVVDMRRYKRQNPEATLLDIAAKFEHDSEVNISRCLRGITWATVNEIEPPIPKKANKKKTESLEV